VRELQYRTTRCPDDDEGDRDDEGSRFPHQLGAFRGDRGEYVVDAVLHRFAGVAGNPANLRSANADAATPLPQGDRSQPLPPRSVSSQLTLSGTIAQGRAGCLPHPRQILILPPPILRVFWRRANSPSRLRRAARAASSQPSSRATQCSVPILNAGSSFIPLMPNANCSALIVTMWSDARQSTRMLQRRW